MIIKGGARSKAQELSTHLLRADTNEKVRIFDLSGVVADDLRGALTEMAAIASGSRCTKPLYHVSISPGLTTILTDEQWKQTITTLEAALGLEGHQRAVVLHTKKDRQHAHIVWNRVDGETLKAVHHSHNYRTHEEVARSLERAFGLEHVQGVHHERTGERPKRRANTRESQQSGRTGWTREQAASDISAAWEMSDSGAGFQAALKERGYVLARGDRKDMVILDPAGGVHGIARRIDGVRAAEVRVRLQDLDPEKLISVDQARAAMGIEAAPQRPRTKGRSGGPTSSPTPPPRVTSPNRYAALRVTVAPRQAYRASTWPAPKLVPSPPTWTRDLPPPSAPSKPAVQKAPTIAGPVRPKPEPTPILSVAAKQQQAERDALHARQQAVAATEAAALARFHHRQLTTLDAHHDERRVILTRDVDAEIVAHNGLGARLTGLTDRQAYNRQLAYLVAKRERMLADEKARQARVREELVAAQKKEAEAATARRLGREELERTALAKRQDAAAKREAQRPRGREQDGPG